MKTSLLAILSFVFCLGLSTPAEAGSCRGKIINPITDVCWSCVFPIKLGPVSVGSDGNKDVKTDAKDLCMCVSGANITIGLNMSFWEPIRTAEIVRTPYCFPSLGGIGFGCRNQSPRPRPHSQ